VNGLAYYLQGIWSYATLALWDFSFIKPRLARLRFELANQDSAGAKTCTALTSMYVNRKGIGVGRLFSLKTALNIHEKGIYNSKNHIRF